MNGIVGGIIGSSSSGLTESEVDARVVAVASGVRIESFFPENGLSLGSSSPATLENNNSLGKEIDVYQFADSAFENSIFTWVPPGNWDGGQVRARYIWYPTTTAAGNVNFAINGINIADNEAPPSSVTYGAWSDTSHGATNKAHFSDWQSLTLTNVAIGDVLFCTFYGRGGSVDWTTTAHARLVALQLEYGVSHPSDDGG